MKDFKVQKRVRHDCADDANYPRNYGFDTDSLQGLSYETEK